MTSRWRSPTSLVVLLVGAAAVAHAGAPIQLEAHLDVSGTVHFEGTTEGRADVLGAVYVLGEDQDDVRLHLRFEGAQLRVYNFPYFVAGGPSGPTATNATVPGPEEQLAAASGDGEIELVSAAARGAFRLLPRDEAGTLQTSMVGHHAFTMSSVTTQSPFSEPNSLGRWGSAPHPRSLVIRVPAALYQEELPGTRQHLDGPMFAVLYGGSFHFTPKDGPPREIVTGERFNASRSAVDPSGTTGFWWYDRTVILLDASAASAEIGSEGVRSWRLALEPFEGRWNGDMTFAGASGRIMADGQALPSKQQLFQSIGNFTGRANYRGDVGTWEIRGPATFVGVDGSTISGDRNAHRWSGTVLVAGGVGILALAVAFATHLGREFLTFISGRNFVKPLESTHRLRFLQQIAASPGLTLRDLAERTGLSKRGAVHHMAVLKRAHYVDEVRNGNALTYMLNSHSYKFYAPVIGLPTNESAAPRVFVAGALAELNHPKRRLIFEALQQNGPSHYAQLVAHWNAAGVARPHPSPSDVTYHATKMEEAGLVVRRRQAGNVVWSVNLDVAALKDHQRRSYLNDPITDGVLRVLREHPGLDLAGIARALGRSMRKPVEQVREKLVLLERAGIVAVHGTGYAVSSESKTTP